MYDYFIAVRFNNIGVSSLKMAITLKYVATFYVLTAHLGIILANDQLDA
jgi:hypothetical protein